MTYLKIIYISIHSKTVYNLLMFMVMSSCLDAINIELGRNQANTVFTFIELLSCWANGCATRDGASSRHNVIAFVYSERFSIDLNMHEFSLSVIRGRIVYWLPLRVHMVIHPWPRKCLDISRQRILQRASCINRHYKGISKKRSRLSTYLWHRPV